MKETVLVYGSPHTPTGKDVVSKECNCYSTCGCGTNIHHENSFSQCPICGSRPVVGP